MNKTKFKKYLRECDKVFLGKFNCVRGTFKNRFIDKSTGLLCSTPYIRTYLTDRFGEVNIVWISQRIKYYEKMRVN